MLIRLVKEMAPERVELIEPDPGESDALMAFP